MTSNEMGEASQSRVPERTVARRKIFDWISNPHSANVTPFQQFTLDVDWEKSPLGPMAKWPTQLRQMVLLVFRDPSPAVVYWGEENTIVYNEPYIQLIGLKHPSLQGQDPKVGFAEVWDHFEKLLANQRETGETVVEANAMLMFHRHGFFEECYFSWKFVPIIGDDGWVVASHATVVETTREVLSDRRFSVVRSLSQHLAASESTTDLWNRLILGLESADKDIPVALLYSLEASSENSLNIGNNLYSATDSSTFLLQGSIGIPDNHELAPSKVELQKDDYFLIHSFRQVVNFLTPQEVPIDGMGSYFDGINWRGHGVPSTMMVVYPIMLADSRLMAFLVIGLNPRRPYDKDYKDFLHLLTQQVTTPQFSAVILREEVKRQHLLAAEEALGRDLLSRQLSESETRFARFATRAPVGLAILEPNGLTLSANPLWRELTLLEIGSERAEWEKVLGEGELVVVDEAWSKVVKEKKTQTIQTRLRRPWRAPDLDNDGNEQWEETHILLTMYPDFDDNGEITTIMSCVQDITGLKWSESQLRQRMDQAIEMKKQQERFIDMTSHEIRNPLSALIGCADEVIASLNEYRGSVEHPKAKISPGLLNPLRLVDEAINAANTIIYCAMHQKRIIDDILTLSRLDSNLLVISPEASQPTKIISSALKMFDAELRRAEIRLNYIEHPSLKSLDINWLLLDPSRVLQVLINLLTNAIKFTRTEAVRNITVGLTSSVTIPSNFDQTGIQYVRKSLALPDQTIKPEWGTGEVIYLTITVTDTGRGLSSHEVENLFSMFGQANPKTYQTYGGSGLGLFISRQLVEMQGGEIGVKSEAGKGSTFQFYVKTRRTAPASLSQKADFQLLVREDALREACATEVEGLQNEVEPIPANVDPPPRNSPSFHILVVEDNLVNQKVVMKQLRKSGHVVHVADNGQEALDFIQKTDFWIEGGERLDVVLLDLEMPVMNGLTCIRHIRQFQKDGLIKGHVPVIAVTANARKDQIMDCLEAGIDDVMTKPYRMQHMLAQIQTLLEKQPAQIMKNMK